MWSTVIYIVLLVLGTAGYAYYLNKVILNKRMQKEEAPHFWGCFPEDRQHSQDAV